MLASPEKEKLTLLRRSLDHGFIDRAQYEQQLAALQAGGLGGEHVEASKRKKGHSVINDYTGLWKIAKVGYPENPLKLHSKDVVHGENRGEWAWNQKGTKMYKHCNFHVDCPVQLRSMQSQDKKSWRLEVLDVSHSLEEKRYRHKRSPFTFEQQDFVAGLLERNKKPQEIVNDLTIDAILAGEVRKRPEGGLEGGHACDTCSLW